MIALVRRAGSIVGEGPPNFTALAKALGCHRSSLYVWKRIPEKYHAKIVKAAKGEITLAMLRAVK